MIRKNTEPDTNICVSISKTYNLCIEELENWQSTIQRDAFLKCSEAKKQSYKPKARPISFIAPNGIVRDSTSLSIAIGESSAEFFNNIQSNIPNLKPVSIHSQPDLREPQKRTKPRIRPPISSAIHIPASRPRSRSFEKNSVEGYFELNSPTSEEQNLQRRISSLYLGKISTGGYEGIVLEKSDIGMVIMGGTEERLIQILTDDSLTDLGYVAEFLITYHYFTSCTKILTYLNSTLKKCGNAPVKRIIYILEKWMNHHPLDFISNKGDCMSLLKDTINLLPKEHSIHSLFKNSILSLKKPIPIPAPRSIRDDTHSTILFNAPPNDIAQQLTFIEQNAFKKIPIHELRFQKWTKDNSSIVAPSLCHCIRHFNKVSYWCATEIVLRSNLKQRVKALKKLIVISQYCVEYRNFNTALAIIGSLGFAAIKRLKKTWKNVPGKYIEVYNNLKAIFDVETNYSGYKKLLVAQHPPMIPYIGLYLRDLTFLELGNPDFLGDDDDQIINYDKYRMISSVLIELRTYQEIQYQFPENRSLCRLLTNHMISFDEDRLYDLSTSLEPPTQLRHSSSSRFKII